MAEVCSEDANQRQPSREMRLGAYSLSPTSSPTVESVMNTLLKTLTLSGLALTAVASHAEVATIERVTVSAGKVLAGIGTLEGRLRSLDNIPLRVDSDPSLIRWYCSGRIRSRHTDISGLRIAVKGRLTGRAPITMSLLDRRTDTWIPLRTVSLPETGTGTFVFRQHGNIARFFNGSGQYQIRFDGFGVLKMVVDQLEIKID